MYVRPFKFCLAQVSAFPLLGGYHRRLLSKALGCLVAEKTSELRYMCKWHRPWHIRGSNSSNYYTTRSALEKDRGNTEGSCRNDAWYCGCLHRRRGMPWLLMGGGIRVLRGHVGAGNVVPDGRLGVRVKPLLLLLLPLLVWPVVAVRVNEGVRCRGGGVVYSNAVVGPLASLPIPPVEVDGEEKSATSFSARQLRACAACAVPVRALRNRHMKICTG